MSRRKVLLISANSEKFPAPVYPLALARLASALQREGHIAVQYDILVHGNERLPNIIAENKPDFIAISIRNIDNTDSQKPLVYTEDHKELVSGIRKTTSAPLVLGGSGFSLFPEKILSALGADYGIVGPGEHVLPKLVTAPEEFKNSRIICENGSVPLITKATHEPAIINYYWEKGGIIGIQSKRGCPRKCSYCTYPLIDGNKVQWADTREIVDEIEHLFRNFGVYYFFIVDSVFNLDKEKELLFAEEIIERSLSISWSAFFAPAGLTENYLQTLRKSGLTHVEFGTDSLSDKILSSLRKGFCVSDVIKSSALCAKLKIHTAHYLAFGAPGETIETVRETVARSRELGNCVFFPFAGIRIHCNTLLHKQATEEGVIKTESDCFEPVFYFPKKLNAEEIWGIVNKEKGNEQVWVLPSRYQKMLRAMERLREQGVKGPLWEQLLR
jgi:radical SAM superfamily enzyme YgiQ (UPF0313 family)